jgi:anthranilate 1,2-dioxygenase (deaminating, decarboxylating) large subunit
MMKSLRVVLSALVVLILLSAGPVFALGQPNVNLGFTSFLDGAPPAGPGFYLSEYLQYYTADRINDEDGSKGLDVDIDVWVLMNQLIYQSDQEILFGGKWGLNVMLPVVSLDMGSNPPGFKDNGTGLGDLLIGPYIQWDPIMGEKGPLMVNRIELQTIFPTGKYDSDKLLNPGSNHFSFNPYWAATVFLGPKATVSWRLHYLWNDKNDDFSFGGLMPTDVDLEPGDAVHANFTAAYEVMPKQLRLGINGYWFDQISDTKVDGKKDKSLEEKVFAIGPGLVWHFSQDTHLFVNAYFETDAESRPEGERYNMRFVHHF